MKMKHESKKHRRLYIRKPNAYLGVLKHFVEDFKLQFQPALVKSEI